jgi:hypothetical protein
MRFHPPVLAAREIRRGLQSAERGASNVTAVIVGALVVLLGGLGGSVLGIAIGNLIAGRFENLAMLGGVAIGALLSLVGVALLAARQRAWVMLAGGMLGAALVATGMALLVR